MSRVKGNIEINGKKYWTLFDTGSRNTYIVKDAIGSLPSWEIPSPERVGLGGSPHIITRECMLIGTVEGFLVRTHARVVDEIGKDEDGKRIEIIFGALAMEEWGIHPVPEEDRLDFTNYSREFIEYTL